MKRILLIALLLLSSPAYADTCGVSLMPAFTANQATSLCKVFGSAVNHSLIPSADNTYDLGSASKQWRNAYLGTNLVFGAASAKIIPGATSLLVRNNADSATNLSITDAGIATFRSSILPATDGNNTDSNLGSGSLGYKNIYLSDATNRAQFLVSNGFYASFPTGQSMFFREGSTDRWSIRATSGDFAASSSGNTVALQEATAGSACMGTLTANGSTPVVTSTTCATTGSRIFLTRTSAETGVVMAWISAISTGVSFSITGEAGDTGTYNWIIFHEAP